MSRADLAAAHPGHDGGPAQAVGLAHHRHFRRSPSSAGSSFPRSWASASSRSSASAPSWCSGLVRWEDINSGVNWGVVLLYAAAISLGVEMKETGAAEWVAQQLPISSRLYRRRQRPWLQFRDLASHHRGLQHHDGGCGGRGARPHRSQDRGCRRSRIRSSPASSRRFRRPSAISRRRRSPPSPSSMPRAISRAPISSRSASG